MSSPGILAAPSPAGRPPWRVDQRRIFAQLRATRGVRQGPLTVTWVAGDPAVPTRVAYAIGHKVGGAVQRNQLRRRLRMLVREAAPRLRPGAYLVGAAPEARTLPFPALRDTLMLALDTLHRKTPWPPTKVAS